MAGKNEVTLTFAGDSKKLERATADASQATKDLAADIDRSSASISDSWSRIGSGGADLRRYGSDLDGVGDGFNDVEDRAMGAGNIIGGVNDLMNPQGPQDYAMGLSDLAAGIRYTVVPSLQDAGRGIKTVMDSMKGANAVALASVAAFAALAAAGVYLAYTQRGANIDADATTAALSSQDRATQKSIQSTLAYVDGLTGLDDVFAEVLAKTPALADEFIAQAEAAGVDEAALDRMRAKLEEVDQTSQFTADSIRGVSDAIRAQSDPTFAALDAMNQLRDANAEVQAATMQLVAAEQEFGAGSVEAMVAAQELQAAHEAAGQAAFGQEGALLELAAQMQESGRGVEDIIAHMQGMVGQNGFTQASVDAVANALRNLPANVETTLHANDLASVDIENVMRNIGSIPRDVVVNIRAQADANRFAAARDLYRAGGGLVPQYAASGMFVGGPRGTDTVPAWLTPGEMVLNKSQQSDLWRALDGGLAGGRGGTVANITVHVAGSIRSDRDLVKVIRDEFARGAFRSVV